MCSTTYPRNPSRTTSLKTTLRLLFIRLEAEKNTRHQSVRGRGGVIAVMYETCWTGLSRPSWEREVEFQLSRPAILRYWAGIPNQHPQTNRLYRRMRIDAAQRELSRSNGERSWRPATAAFRTQIGIAAIAPGCFPTEPTFGAWATTNRGGLGRSARARLRMGYIWCDIWMARRRPRFLFLRRYTRLRRELYEVLGVYK